MEVVDSPAGIPELPRHRIVNSADPKELQNGLGMTAGEATAILEFRKSNGNFKDVAALQKVPGVDAKKIEAKKDQIVF